MSELELRTEPNFPTVHVPGPIVVLNEDGKDYPALPTLLDGVYQGEIRQAIDRLYRAFASARLSDDFEGCPHCFTESDIRYVRDTPVSNFTHRDLILIGQTLLATLGSAQDVPYFIPRFMEALAEDLPIDLRRIVDHIAAVPRALWTTERLCAVRVVFDVLLRAGQNEYAAGGAFSDFANPEMRDYVSARLAELPEVA